MSRTEQLRRESSGPTARRGHALRRLRARAGRYRERCWALGVLALGLAVAFALSAAGVFTDDNETPTLGTGYAGVMAADSSAVVDTTHPARTDSAANTDALTAPADSLEQTEKAPADSLEQTEKAPADSLEQTEKADADNTKVVKEAGETGAEVVVGRGEASYYGARLAGNPTASGEAFDPSKLTAAHRTLPLGSRVRVTNLRNDETVTVRINDRGPFHGNRVLDLSRRAAERIGMLARGTARVKIELLEEK
jgi:rare lipoprotein A (peptidoglycan hydrolase)